MEGSNFYHKAHLVVAAIRILEHQQHAPPSLENICEALAVSLEQGNLLCRKLKEMAVIDMVEGAYGIRLFIKNHLKLEEIERDAPESKLSEELEKFRNARKDHTKKIESLQAAQAEKKRSLMADLEKELKKKLRKK